MTFKPEHWCECWVCLSVWSSDLTCIKYKMTTESYSEGHISSTFPVASMNPVRLMKLLEIEAKYFQLSDFLQRCGLSVKVFLILPRVDFVFFRWTIIAVICWAKYCLANTVLLDQTICIVLFLHTGLIYEMA